MRYARVGYRLGYGSLVAAKLQVGGTLPIGEGAGVVQVEADQLAATFAYSRDWCMWGGATHAAVFHKGAYVGEEPPPNVSPAELDIVPVVGDAPYNYIAPGGKGLPENWGLLLGVACDYVLGKVRTAKRSSEIPLGWSMMVPTALGGGIVAIIVGGAAVAIVGAVAAYRYLDPDARAAMATVATAAQLYQARLEVLKKTGKLPDPSPIETSQAEAIKKLAGKGSANGWMLGGAVLGGLAGGMSLGAWAGKQLER